jgi:hypothetical protein
MSELIPEPVAASYRKIRKQWYDRKVPKGKSAEHKAQKPEQKVVSESPSQS